MPQPVSLVLARRRLRRVMDEHVAEGPGVDPVQALTQESTQVLAVGHVAVDERLKRIDPHEVGLVRSDQPPQLAQKALAPQDALGLHDHAVPHQHAIGGAQFQPGIHPCPHFTHIAVAVLALHDQAAQTPVGGDAEGWPGERPEHRRLDRHAGFPHAGRAGQDGAIPAVQVAVSEEDAHIAGHPRRLLG